MKPFFVLLILSVCLVTPAVAQFPELPPLPTFGDLGTAPPAPATPRWTHPAPTYNSSNNYGADFYAPSFREQTYQRSLQSPYNQSLRQRYQDPSMGNGAEYYDGLGSLESQFDQYRRSQERQNLRETYQNQKPIACGPAYSPRAREGC